LPIFPFGPSRPEDEQGIFRLSRPSLGKTGLVKIAQGRHPTWERYNFNVNLWGLTDFYERNKYLDYDQEAFCFLALPQTLSPVKPVNGETERQKFYSFNGSAVFNNRMPPLGSHADVGSYDEVVCDLHVIKNDKEAKTKRLLYEENKNDWRKLYEEKVLKPLLDEEDKEVRNAIFTSVKVANIKDSNPEERAGGSLLQEVFLQASLKPILNSDNLSDVRKMENAIHQFSNVCPQIYENRMRPFVGKASGQGAKHKLSLTAIEKVDFIEIIQACLTKSIQQKIRKLQMDRTYFVDEMEMQ